MLKGGVGLKKDYPNTREEAFYEFMRSSEIKILADGSTSAFTITATFTGNPADSPYITVDLDKFMQPVTRILVKIIPSKPGGEMETKLIRHRLRRIIEISNYDTITEECNIQKDVYRKSVMETTVKFNPICPAVLHCENPVQDRDKFWHLFKDKVVARPSKSLQNELEELTDLMDVGKISEGTTFSIIVMEFLDGYELLSDVYSQASPEEQDHIISLVDVELTRLHALGYFHGDFHKGNCMYNKNAQGTGKAMIIDFGRTIDANANPRDLLTKHVDLYYSETGYTDCYEKGMTHPDCLNEEKLHKNGVPLTPAPIIEKYFKSIIDVNKQKLKGIDTSSIPITIMTGGAAKNDTFSSRNRKRSTRKKRSMRKKRHNNSKRRNHNTKTKKLKAF